MRCSLCRGSFRVISCSPHMRGNLPACFLILKESALKEHRKAAKQIWSQYSSKGSGNRHCCPRWPYSNQYTCQLCACYRRDGGRFGRYDYRINDARDGAVRGRLRSGMDSRRMRAKIWNRAGGKRYSGYDSGGFEGFAKESLGISGQLS